MKSHGELFAPQGYGGDMLIRWIVAALHLLALGVGLGAWAVGGHCTGYLMCRACSGCSMPIISGVLPRDLDRHRVGAGVRGAREGLRLLPAQPRRLGQDDAARARLAPRSLAYGVADPLAYALRPWRGHRHTASGPPRWHKRGPDRSRDGYGLCRYGHGTRLLTAPTVSPAPNRHLPCAALAGRSTSGYT